MEVAVSLIVDVERAAAATWPTSTVHRVGGWMLRHCTLLRRKRSNSALPPRVVEDRSSAVDQVERFYAERGQEPVVQVSPLHEHGELDDFLAGRGYQAIAPTEIMIADAERVVALCAPGPFEVHASAVPHAGWLAACAAVGTSVEPSLSRIAQPARFLAAAQDDRPVGVGLFVVSDDWCGVYCMATDVEWRRRGVARSVLHAGALWARDVGADRLFLQVEADNAAARRLYGRIGFEVSHRYHYRVRYGGGLVGR
jgi:N-acetylglutamate synthase